MASTFASAATSAPAASSALKFYNFTIKSDSHPWQPRVSEFKTHCVPYGSESYMVIPMSLFQPMASSFYHFDPRAEMAVHRNNTTSLMTLWGSVAAAMAESPYTSTSDGKVTGEYQINTVTVVYDAGDASKVVALVFAMFNAVHQLDNEKMMGATKIEEQQMALLRERRSPSGIVAQITRVMGSAVTASVMGVASTGPRSIVTHGKVPNWFHRMTESRYRALADVYHPRREIPGLDRALSPSSPKSYYNWLNVFSLTNAMQILTSVNAAPEFCDPDNWQTVAVAPIVGKEFHRPRDGTTTYRISGSELVPDRFLTTFFPHVAPPLMDYSHPAMQSIIRRSYVGPRTATGDPDPRTADDELSLARAQEKARDTMAASGEAVHTDFTMETFQKNCREAFRTSVISKLRTSSADILKVRAAESEKARADAEAEVQNLWREGKRLPRAVREKSFERHLPGGAPDTASLPLHEVWKERQRCIELRMAFEDEWLKRFWTVFTEYGDLSHAECAIAKWVNETLALRGSYCMPYDPPFGNLTPFATVIAARHLYREAIDKTHATHEQFMMLDVAVLTNPMKPALGNSVMQCGESSLGKSFMLDSTHANAIPGTVDKRTSSSAKAGFTHDFSKQTHMKTIIEHEAMVANWGIGTNAAHERGKGTASDQANTDRAAIQRDLQASGVCVYDRLEKTPDGAFVSVRYELRAKVTYICATNSDTSDLPRNTAARFALCTVADRKRGDGRTVVGTLQAEAHTPAQKAMTEGFRMRFRRDQAFIYLICMWQEADLLPKWTTVATDSLMTHVLDLAQRRGMAGTLDPRSVIRIRKACLCAASLDLLYRVCDGPNRVMDDKSWDWVRFLRAVRPRLVTAPEHMVWALTLYSEDMVNRSLVDVVRAVSSYFKLPPAPASIRANRDRPDDVDWNHIANELNVAGDGAAAAAGASMRRRRGFGRGGAGGARARRGRGGRGGGGGVFSLAGAGAGLEGIGGGEYTHVFGDPGHRSSDMTLVDESVPVAGRNYGEFFYVRWSDTGLSVRDNAARAKRFMDIIAPSMQSKVPTRRLHELAMRWLDTNIPVPDPLRPGSKTCYAFYFEPGPGGLCETLRINKAFLWYQQQSLLNVCIRDVISWYGFPDQEYITNDSEDLPYIFKRITRPPAVLDEATGTFAREPGSFLWGNTVNPFAEAILEKMCNSAVIAEKRDDPSSGMMLIQAAMADMIAAAPWVAITSDDPASNIFTTAVTIHLVSTGEAYPEPSIHGEIFRMGDSQLNYVGEYTYPKHATSSLWLTRKHILREARRYRDWHSSTRTLSSLRLIARDHDELSALGLEEWASCDLDQLHGGEGPKLTVLGTVEHDSKRPLTRATIKRPRVRAAGAREREDGDGTSDENDDNDDAVTVPDSDDDDDEAEEKKAAAPPAAAAGAEDDRSLGERKGMSPEPRDGLRDLIESTRSMAIAPLASSTPFSYTGALSRHAREGRAGSVALARSSSSGSSSSGSSPTDRRRKRSAAAAESPPSAESESAWTRNTGQRQWRADDHIRRAAAAAPATFDTPALRSAWSFVARSASTPAVMSHPPAAPAESSGALPDDDTGGF